MDSLKADRFQILTGTASQHASNVPAIKGIAPFGLRRNVVVPYEVGIDRNAYIGSYLIIHLHSKTTLSQEKLSALSVRPLLYHYFASF